MAENIRKPEIRFNGFDDDWEQRKLEDVVEVCSGRDYKHLTEGDIPVYGTGGYMLSVNEALSYDEDAIGIGRKGTIDKPYILKAPFWTVDTLFYAIPKEDYDLNFVYDIFQNIDWKSKDESTGVPSLSKTTIYETSALMPDYDEQIEIGAFFSNIDNLIALHQRKYSQILNIKKSLLEKMFPQNGVRVPEIRFAGFTDDWIQRKIYELGNIVTGSTPSTNDSSNFGGGYMFVSPADIQDNRFIDHTITTLSQKGFSKGRVLKSGAILFVSIGSTIGKVGQTNIPCITNQQINAIEPYNEYDLNFVFSLLLNHSKAIQQMAATQAVPIINKTTFGNVEVYIPIDKSEQKAIGEFFLFLDNFLNLCRQELEYLKNIKQFSLAKMFVI